MIEHGGRRVERAAIALLEDPGERWKCAHVPELDPELSGQTVTGEIPNVPSTIEMSGWTEIPQIIRPRGFIRLMAGPVARRADGATIPITLGEQSTPLLDATTSNPGPAGTPVGWTIFVEIAAESVSGQAVRYAFFVRQPPS